MCEDCKMKGLITLLAYLKDEQGSKGIVLV